MLSEDTLDNLMQPVIDRQEEINTYVITKIAERINTIGQVKPSDVQKLIQLRNVGGDVRLINQKLAEYTNLQVYQIKQIIKAVAYNVYTDAKPFYDYRHKPYIPFSKNRYLQKQVEAVARQTAGTYKNLSKAQAFMLRDLANPEVLIPTPLSKAYQSVVDEAIQAAQTGVIDYNTAMRRTLKQLVDSGLRQAVYNTESGRVYSQRMDTAVRRNLLDGIRAINQKVQDITGEEYGADGVEISVHSNPAPDHAAMQGHQYSKAEFEKMQSAESFHDVQGRVYSGFERAVGTLNCRHFAWNIIIGFAPQNFSDTQLQEILDRNEKGYTLPNGKHLTMYECTQYQRKLETAVRHAKDGQIAARAAGDTQLAMNYQAKINKYSAEYKAFSKACGLSEKRGKMTVSGYHKISVK